MSPAAAVQLSDWQEGPLLRDRRTGRELDVRWRGVVDPATGDEVPMEIGLWLDGVSLIRLGEARFFRGEWCEIWLEQEALEFELLPGGSLRIVLDGRDPSGAVRCEVDLNPESRSAIFTQVREPPSGVHRPGSAG